MPEETSPKVPPPPLVGINFDANNIKTKKRMVQCKVCEKEMNTKSIARHMRDQHNESGPGTQLKWS